MRIKRGAQVGDQASDEGGREDVLREIVINQDVLPPTTDVVPRPFAVAGEKTIYSAQVANP